MKKVFLDINFVCDLIVNRKNCETSRNKVIEFVKNKDAIFLATSSISTIYYIANNFHKENVFFLQQMKFLKNEAKNLKDKLNSENAFDIASFFINEVLKEPKKEAMVNIATILYDLCNDIVELVPLSKVATFSALEYCKNNPNSDLEDILQYFIAKENGCDEIYTNDKNFPKLDIALIRTDPKQKNYEPK